MKKDSIQIHFGQNLNSYNVDRFNDIKTIVLKIEYNRCVNVPLDGMQTKEDIESLVIKLAEHLKQSYGKSYNFSYNRVVFGEYVENKKQQVVVEVTYYLYNTENYE